MKISKINNSKNIIFLKKNIQDNLFIKRNKAIFFDRDGVLIKDSNYIKDPKDVFLLNGVTDLLKETKRLGFINIIVTNQSGISRKFFTWEDYEKVTRKMLEFINIHDSINAIYANGEGPNELPKYDSWRKPNPNMILRAAKDYNIDLNKSILIGDILSDISAGVHAGIKNLFHVLTGKGFNERQQVIENYYNKNKSFTLSIIDDLSFFKKEKFLSLK